MAQNEAQFGRKEEEVRETVWRKNRNLSIIAVCVAMLMAIAPGALADDDDDDDHKRWHRDASGLYVPKLNHDAVRQMADLISDGNKDDAALIWEMATTPQAVWIESGTPKEVKREVRRTVKRAAAKRSVPVLVAYNIPFRDCAQFSAGGATTVDEYKAWIDGFARGIGNKEAIVILEPDGLGIIPWYTNLDGEMEWCQPAEAEPATAADERFEMLNYAVDALKAKPKVSVYLDGTHSAWLNVGDASQRLYRADVDRADGFYLNASNYQFTVNQEFYGTWISKCIANGNFAGCPNQYWNGGPPTGWEGTAMDSYLEWSNEPYSGDAADLAWNTVGIDDRYADWPAGPHFVIDLSRNGLGPWDPSTSAYGPYPDPQDWCNPPGRGVGAHPTLDIGNPLIDAYLWIKTPGESDGECTRGLGPAGETVDPEWGIIDPGAGDWFREQALELAQKAVPPLDVNWPRFRDALDDDDDDDDDND